MKTRIKRAAGQVAPLIMAYIAGALVFQGFAIGGVLLFLAAIIVQAVRESILEVQAGRIGPWEREG